MKSSIIQPTGDRTTFRADLALIIVTGIEFEIHLLEGALLDIVSLSGIVEDCRLMQGTEQEIYLIELFIEKPAEPTLPDTAIEFELSGTGKTNR